MHFSSSCLLLLLFLLVPPITAPLPHSPCSPAPSITFRGSNDVTRVGGAALVLFGPLQCANCYAFLRRLNDIATQRNHRIIVVAPDFESNHIIQRTASAFPNLQIDRAGEGWPRFQAANFDAMVLDSCGRISETLTWPNSDVTTSSAVLQALDASNSKCGQCHYPQKPRDHRHPNFGINKKVNAYLKEHEKMERSRNNPNQPPYHPLNIQNVYYPPQQNYQNPPQNPHQNQNPSYQYNQYQSSQNYGFYTPPPPPPPPIPTKNMVKTTTTPEPIDYDYYPQDDTPTTQTPQTQIPRPPSSNQPDAWPTYTPYQNQQNYQNPYHYQNPGKHHYQPLPLMDANLPCSAFTDDICYQQQERSGGLMPKCCNKGIYLTDVCVPGKCSNSTTQLCCFQKFLQAKYSCCNDPLQDEGAPKMTNMFNKCCHNLFVTEDPCCPELAARRYWTTAYEVCMPTVTVDFSPVKFEVKTMMAHKVHFTEGVRVLDLSQDRQWEFNCTYGQKRPQFAYLP